MKNGDVLHINLVHDVDRFSEKDNQIRELFGGISPAGREQKFKKNTPGEIDGVTTW